MTTLKNILTELLCVAIIGGQQASPSIDMPPPPDTFCEDVLRSLPFIGDPEITPIAAVPEPQTWLMLGAGLVLLATFTRRRRRDERSPTAR